MEDPAAQETPTPAPAVDRDALAAAVVAEVAAADLNTLQLKVLRGLVEHRMGLDAGALKAVRDDFKALVLEQVALRQAVQAGGAESGDEEAAPPAKKAPLRGRAAPMILMPPLQKLLKEERLTRSDITKRIWAIIRERNLPKRAGAVRLDDELATALGRKTISFKTMGKTIETLVKSAADLVGYDSQGNWVGYDDDAKAAESGSESADAASASDDGASGSDEEEEQEEAPPPARKRGRASASAAASPAKRSRGKPGLSGPAVVLNDRLAALTGARVTSRSQISKWMWSRIRARSLQVPSDRRKVAYDDELAAAMGRRTATIFSMNKHISAAVRRATPEEAEQAVLELELEEGGEEEEGEGEADAKEGSADETAGGGGEGSAAAGAADGEDDKDEAAAGGDGAADDADAPASGGDSSSSSSSGSIAHAALPAPAAT